MLAARASSLSRGVLRRTPRTPRSLRRNESGSARCSGFMLWNVGRSFMNGRRVFALFLIAAAAFVAAPVPCAAQAAPDPAPSPSGPVDKPGPRRVPGFDVNALDQSVNACTDFYQFSCGGWLARNPVPADRARWGRFDELAERNQIALRGILDKATASTADRQIGDYYTACMDEKGIEALGLKPVKATLDRIAGLTTRADLAGEVARLHSQGVEVLFGFGAQQDFKDATRVIAAVDQGGLGLPDRDYYLKSEPRFADVRKQYAPHIARMLELAGDKPAAATEAARQVLEIEIALARGSLERAKRRDPANRYHMTKRADLIAMTPAFGWEGYFAAVGAPLVPELNVVWPDFFKAMQDVVEKSAAVGGPVAAGAVRERELRVLREDADRGEGAAAALEALRADGRRPSRRGAGPALRGGHLRRRGEGADVEAGGRPRAGAPEGHPR